MNYIKKNFSKKILDINILKKKIDRIKKTGKTVVMCHGTFDLVHPGHIRHLHYAKEKADILIVSVTGDNFVTKKTLGTYVPEDLRVRNIAALELVDYTFIDKNFKPLEAIKKIKPNFFLKGYEYNLDKSKNEKTIEEKKILDSVGGKIIFSPGDLVYSSTKFQQTLKPDLRYDKFNSLLKKEKISFQTIKKILKKTINKKIHVIGDLILDKYNYCDLLGRSSKTPTFSIRPFRSEKFIGGAGIVAKHLKALGADVTLTTVIGNDDHKDFILKDLEHAKIKKNIIYSKNTIFKERFWANDYKIVQVDYVDNSLIDNKIQKKISNFIKKTKSDVVVFSDFRHGIFNKDLIQTFSSQIKKGIIKVADSQVSSRWGNITDFENFDILFPNETEARFSLGDQDSGVRALGTNLLKKTNCKNLILKLGDKGSMIFRNEGFYPKEFFPLDSFVTNKIDTIGSGDAYLAATTYFYSETKDIVLSSIIGNFAASVACEQHGNIPISKEQILTFIEKIDF